MTIDEAMKEKKKEQEEAHRILDEIRRKNPKISIMDLQKEYDRVKGKKVDEEPLPSFTTKPINTMNLREQNDLFHYDKIGYDWLIENREANWSYSQFAEQYYGAMVYDKDWQKK